MTIDLQTPLLGPVDVSPALLFAKFSGHTYDDATVTAFANALAQHASATGIRASLVAAQIAKETGWFAFGGQVQPGQFNLAGLGATNGGAAGASFPDVATGVMAVYAHWLVYLYGDHANWPPGLMAYAAYDARYDAVLSTGHAGQIHLLGDVTNGVWAFSENVPLGGDNGYATGIAAIANTLSTEPQPQPSNGGTGMQLIDIRDQLATNPNGGPNQKASGPRQGIIIHYSGVDYDPSRAILDILTSEAQYHVTEDWGGGARGDGLMYHISVDPQSGQAYLCRDLDAVLWHCAYWGPGGNDSGYSIHVPFGPNGQISAQGLAGLASVVNALSAQDGIPMSMVKGHQEVSPTACPGPLMDAFVLPYRAGQLTPVNPNPQPGPSPADGFIHFDVVPSYIGGGFREYWLAHGGLEIFGYPLTDEITESDRTVQYFQRAVFEYHGELPYQAGVPGGGRVLLRLLGSDAAARAGFTGPGIDPITKGSI